MTKDLPYKTTTVRDTAKNNGYHRPATEKNVIASEDMDTPAEFYAGEAEDRRFRYLNAKHELDRWMAAHGQQGLLEPIEKLNNGEDFDMAYGS